MNTTNAIVVVVRAAALRRINAKALPVGSQFAAPWKNEVLALVAVIDEGGAVDEAAARLALLLVEHGI